MLTFNISKELEDLNSISENLKASSQSLEEIPE